jgi:hypothetical protein
MVQPHFSIQQMPHAHIRVRDIFKLSHHLVIFGALTSNVGFVLEHHLS